MSLLLSKPIRHSLALLLMALFVAGCSSSSSPQSASELNDANGVNDIADGNTGNSGESTDGVDEATSTTRVNFDITVPAYVSNTLQVRLVWGDIDTTAMWNSDELWTASIDLPVNTEHQLMVTFNDDNGAITLGSYESSYRTGTNQSAYFKIAANDFDTDRWDNDGDGESNLSESIAGTNPLGSQALEPVQPTLKLVADKTFSFSWLPSQGAQYYRILENPDGISGFSQIGDDLDASLQSFDHRVSLYKRISARYIIQACNLSGCLDSQELNVSGAFEQAIGYFKSSITEDSTFSSPVLSEDGNTMAVGGSAVHVFVRNSEDWQLQAVLGQGHEVELSADGNTLIIQRPVEGFDRTDINGVNINDFSRPPASGAVYVFVRSNGVWTQQALLTETNPGNIHLFGSSASLSSDGNTLAVGAPGANNVAGTVNVFERNNGVWAEQQILQASNPGFYDGNDTNSIHGDSFGANLSLSDDGKSLAVGAKGEGSAATGINGDQKDNSRPNTGAVYVFELNNNAWQQQAYLKASNADTFFGFGDSISLSENGNTLAVGATGENSASSGVNGDQDNFLSLTGSSSGAVYVFVRNGDIWQQQAYLKASNTGQGDQFGRAVSLSADGDTLAVAATFESSAAVGINGDQNNNSAQSSGAVYVFSRSASNWQQSAYVKASNTDSTDYFGSSLSLSANGESLAVSASNEASSATEVNGDQSNNFAPHRGAVYLY